MEILKSINLTKLYRKTRALDGVNLTIQKGDIYGFIGKNGAGKTTLIRVIAGIAEPTKGSFALFGETEPMKVVRARKKMAAVVESPALHLQRHWRERFQGPCSDGLPSQSLQPESTLWEGSVLPPRWEVQRRRMRTLGEPYQSCRAAGCGELHSECRRRCPVCTEVQNTHGRVCSPVKFVDQRTTSRKSARPGCVGEVNERRS